MSDILARFGAALAAGSIRVVDLTQVLSEDLLPEPGGIVLATGALLAFGLARRQRGAWASGVFRARGGHESRHAGRGPRSRGPHHSAACRPSLAASSTLIYTDRPPAHGKSVGHVGHRKSAVSDRP